MSHVFFHGFLFLFISYFQPHVEACFGSTSEISHPSPWMGVSLPGHTYAEFLCPDGCILSWYDFGVALNRITSLRFTCSDFSTVSPSFGKSQGTTSFNYAVGITKLNVDWDTNGNILHVQASIVDYLRPNRVFFGEAGDLYASGPITGSSECDVATSGIKKAFSGVYVYYNPSGSVSSFKFRCSTVICPRGFFINTIFNQCDFCNKCATDQYNSLCGLGVQTVNSPGNCGQCPSNVCNTGYYLNGCGTDQLTYFSSPGICTACGSCNAGQYRISCSGMNPGACTPCDTSLCSSGQYLSGCSGTSAGSCRTCSTCNAGQYLSGCSGTSSGSCIACATCNAGQYLAGCSGTSPGSCQACTTCNTGFYLSGCSRQSAGTCTDCISCSTGQYLSGCGNTQQGSCLNCPAGKTSMGGKIESCTACTETIPSSIAQFVSLCEWKCNAGYYKDTSTTCVSCTPSSTCNAGEYKPPCTDGINDQTCTACTNKIQDTNAVYLGPSNDHSNNCVWGCNAGFYRRSSPLPETCSQCLITCGVGYYPKSNCYIQSTYLPSDAPQCKPCALLLSNYYFTTNGKPNEESSCNFTCNSGYFLKIDIESKLKQCSLCTPNKICPDGQELIPCNSTSDAVCGTCPPLDISIGNYKYETNKCLYGCKEGYEKIVNICSACIAGKYKTVGQNYIYSACIVCPSGNYQASTAQSACKEVPKNGAANTWKSEFTCNGGYFRVEGSTTDTTPTCEICEKNNVQYLSQANNVQWSTSASCSIASFSCNAGYYRDWTYVGCQPCPSSIPLNSVAVMISACALCTNTDPKLDRKRYCPYQCNNGYYSSLTEDYACIKCSAITCNSGLYVQPCSGGATSDSCMTCTYQLKSFQEWTYAAACEWHCSIGYSLVSADLTCQQCSPGKYKTSTGNQACTESLPGSYSVSPLSVLQCDKGTFSNTYSSTACTPCDKGTYMPNSGASVCLKCVDRGTYPTSISSVLGATTCTLCTALTPYAADGITCTLPRPPCPPGFYYSFASLQSNTQQCELCPMGTYCSTAGASPSICPFAKPYSVVPAVSIANCTATNPYPEEPWRTPCY